MFNDKYGLTKAVLDGRKTQTRRLSTFTLHEGDLEGELKQVYPDEIFTFGDKWFFKYKGQVYHLPKENYPKYNIGEIVAIAQSYKDAGYSYNYVFYRSIAKIDGYKKETACSQKGWTNKMFVAPNLMPHQIRITNVRIERLQGISDVDCLKEGVVISEPKIKGGVRMYYPCEYLKSCANKIGWGRVYHTPREAYAALIDKVGKKGDWNRNPYVFVYNFELVK